MIFSAIDLERQKFKPLDIMEIDHYNRLSLQGIAKMPKVISDTLDENSICEACLMPAAGLDFSHIVEAYETTMQILCDDCWLDFCEGTL